MANLIIRLTSEILDSESILKNQELLNFIKENDGPVTGCHFLMIDHRYNIVATVSDDVLTIEWS